MFNVVLFFINDQGKKFCHSSTFNCIFECLDFIKEFTSPDLVYISINRKGVNINEFI